MVSLAYVDLTAGAARAIRMTSLLLAGEQVTGEQPAGGQPAGALRPAGVAGVVEWFGAMQAQDIASGLWSLGVRLPHLDRAAIEAEIEQAAVLRTWPMRGTIHFVPSRDARWMLDLTGKRVWAALGKRRADLGIDDTVFTTALDVLGAGLSGGRRLTRRQALDLLDKAGIDTTGQRGYHLLMSASLHGVTCIAPHVGREQTFALLDDWVTAHHQPDRDEALAILAGRYFASHGPASERDFAGWTGLTLADARRGIAAHDLATVRVNDVDMLVRPTVLDVASGRDEIVVLPGFDEYLLGFKDRSLMATPQRLAAVVPGNNGMFAPTVVLRGEVIAIWKRTSRSSGTVVTLTPFGRVPRARVTDAFAGYARYLGHPVEVRWA